MEVFKNEKIGAMCLVHNGHHLWLKHWIESKYPRGWFKDPQNYADMSKYIRATLVNEDNLP